MKKNLLYRIILIKCSITYNEENFVNVYIKMTLFIMNFIYNEFFFWHNEESRDQVRPELANDSKKMFLQKRKRKER